MSGARVDQGPTESPAVQALRLRPVERRWLVPALLALALGCYALGFVHLRADFPNFSPWQDWSKMTDEGWYGGGAIHRVLEGRWILPGAFNPVVAMPVWPLLLAAWFKLTGVSMVAARALTMLVYGASLGLLYLLLRRSAGSVAAAAALVLMAVNPFCYAFDRLAVLEPVMVFWLLLGWWVADRTRPLDVVRPLLLGGIVFLLVMTKTTGLFLAPAIAYQLWAVQGWPRRGGLRPLAIAGLSALGLWLAYYLLAVRPHHLADFRLLFSINRDRVHLGIVAPEAWKVLRSGLWLSPVLFPAALLALLWAAGGARELLRIPLFGAAVVASTGYLLFIGYHSNLQPRYFLVIAQPVVIVLVLTVANLWSRRLVAVAGLATAVLALTGGYMLFETVRLVAHPQYSFAAAADDIAARMRAQPGSRPLLLSNSGDDISLFTGIPAVPAEYSSGGLGRVLKLYDPGWLAVWPGREDPWIARLRSGYRLDEAAHYTVFDDPERNRLVLYRMEKIAPAPAADAAAPADAQPGSR